MNQLKLSVRCGDNPRVIREEEGVPSFVTVFVLHHPFKHNKSPEAIIPITVKASKELAPTLAQDLAKGTSFIVEGQLSYFRNPETRRESFSIWAQAITDIVQPKRMEAK